MAKVPSLVFLNHLGNASVCQNVSAEGPCKTGRELRYQPSVNKTVQHFRCLLYQVRLVGVVLQLIIRLQVQDHVQRLPVVGHLLVQPRQIKLVLNVVLVNLAEELIPSQATKPRYPRHLGSIDRQL